MRIYELLELDKLDCCVALIKNARSSKMGRKDIIKIEGDLSINFDVLGFIDNNITVCTIKNGELVKKENIDQIFELCDEKAHRYRCLYCEQAYKSHE